MRVIIIHFDLLVLKGVGGVDPYINFIAPIYKSPYIRHYTPIVV